MCKSDEYSNWGEGRKWYYEIDNTLNLKVKFLAHHFLYQKFSMCLLCSGILAMPLLMIIMNIYALLILQIMMGTNLAVLLMLLYKFEIFSQKTCPCAVLRTSAKERFIAFLPQQVSHVKVFLWMTCVIVNGCQSHCILFVCNVIFQAFYCFRDSFSILCCGVCFNCMCCVNCVVFVLLISCCVCVCSDSDSTIWENNIFYFYFCVQNRTSSDEYPNS